ncbi:MAG: DNA/RNA non-specific endonuclease [Acidobacteriota bacterium]|nr:DNA/RNA non-specific endonuclease [Acidobacteriota bacterium]
MKKFLSVFLFALCLCAVWQFAGKTDAREIWNTYLPSPNIVISQFYGGGGQTGAAFKNDFVELFNRGGAPINLNGWSLQYASATGTDWLVTNLPNATIQPGQYFLIQLASSGGVGADLPAPDFIAPNVTGRNFVLNMATAAGKFAVVSTTVQLPASTCPVDSSIIDLVGYGDSATCFENVKTPNLNVANAARRNANGCQDTDNNANDFSLGAPAPRNSQTATNSCGNIGNILAASGAANPNTVSPGGTTLLTVRVFPATDPPSSGISVFGNLTAISGAANQQFFDNGTNGDVTAGDNIYSFQTQIPAVQAGGSLVIPATVTDAQSRTANAAINITISAPLPGDDPLVLGNPSNATPDVNNPFNYLMQKPQYSLSYHRDNGTPNWVAWRLDASWIGGAPRQDDFRPDPSLPSGWYQVTPDDYSGSGFDRGHMTPSGDRTRSAADNSATFLMTNIVPQTPENNQRAWEDFESYCRTLAQAGNELYIISGGVGSRGRIGNNRVNVPAVTWKVVLVLPNGDNDLERINKNTRTIAVIMPNDNTVGFSWRQYRTSVQRVEGLTGYNFYSNVPRIIQNIIERRVDFQ